MTEQFMNNVESELRAALNPGAMRPEFAAQLRARLRTHAARVGNARPRRSPRLRPAWAASLVLALILALTVLVIGPQRVLAQVLEWLRYIPGIGFVDTSVGLRVLEEEVSQTRDGITVTMQSGLIDAEHTWLTFYIEGIQFEQLPNNESDPGCPPNPQLELPDGTLLEISTGSGGGARTWTRWEVQYPALPADVNDAVFKLGCVPGLRDGSAPEDWELALHFVPAPADYEVLPVLPVPTAESTDEPQPGTANFEGIELRAINVVELESGYLFQGQLDFTQSAYQDLMFSEFDLKFADANGVPILVETSEDSNQINTDPRLRNWSLRTNRKDFASPVTITLDKLSVQYFFGDEGQIVEFDFGAAPQSGQTWQLNRTLNVEGEQVTLADASFEQRGDGMYSLMLHIQIDMDRVSSASFTDLDNTSSAGFGGGGGGMSGDIYQSIGYDYLPSGVHRLQLDSVYTFADVPGPWVIQVDVPTALGATPSATDNGACVSQATWQALLAAPSAQLPFASDQRVLVEGPYQDGVYFPELFISDLNGGNVVTIGPGGWGAVSSDGRWVAYVDVQGLHTFDVTAQRDTLIAADGAIYSPLWSPDGSQIAYLSGGNGAWVMNADGSAAHQLAGTTADMVGLAGWMPDGKQLAVISIVPDGSMLQLLNIETGDVRDLFLMESRKGGAAQLAPDGAHVAFSGEVFGSFSFGVYASDLDGSAQRLIGAPGEQSLFLAGAWSPDSAWLALNPLDTTEFEFTMKNAIVTNVSTCESFLLNRVLGNVIGWVIAR